MLSPLTHSETTSVPNSPYLKDKTGLWFIPGADCLTRQKKAWDPSEVTAYESIVNWLTTSFATKPGTFTDDEANPFLAQALRAKGWSEPSLTTFQTDLHVAIHTFNTRNIPDARRWLEEINIRVGGHVFLRIPDNETEGVERELSLAEPAPVIWNLHSFLELLAQVQNYRIIYTQTFKPGQRDIILRRFERPPTICAGMIVKNEERDLPTCLDTLRGVINGLCLIDTGSTDRTVEVAKKWAETNGVLHDIRTYTGASEQDANGDWKLWNFGKARNQYLDAIEKMKDFDWVLWMDADDEVRSPEMLRSLAYLASVDYHGIGMSSGGTKWVHHRLWKNHLGVRYQGACHEYPIFGSRPGLDHMDCEIYHNGEPGVGESSNQRNLRILEREVAEQPTTRNTFYLANTHKDGGRWKEAIKAYRQRIKLGIGYEDEYWFAHLYLIRCLRFAGNVPEALREIFKLADRRSDWAEFWMEGAQACYGIGHYKKALGFCLMAQDMPIVPTALFREANQYTDQPYRLASWCSEHLGDTEGALRYARQTLKWIGTNDQSWNDRISRLEGIVGKK